jgi:hypothetical protein
MNYRVNRRVAAGLVSIGIALSASSSSADHAWGNYHWARTANPFTLSTGDNVDAKWDAYLIEAITDWNQSGVVILKKVTGAAKGKCRPTAGRIEVCNATYGQNGWLGIAQIWISGSHITQGTTKLNDTYFNTSTYNTPAWRRLVTCQEIAHDFGLAHQDETFNNRNLGSCMDYTSDPDGGGAFGPSNEHPNAHDFEMIGSIYSHLDGSSTVGSASANTGAPAAMNQIDFEGPGQWGRLVRSSRNGRVQIYEVDFGKGNKVITHVFWANPDEDARQH